MLRCLGPGSCAALTARALSASCVEHSACSNCKFRPCIDIHQGRVKQIVGSSLHDKQGSQLVVNFEAAEGPAHFAQMYKLDDLKGGHVIMLGADEESRAAAQEALEAYPGGMQLGGGVTPENAASWLDAGASHVIVTSYVFQDGRLQQDRLQQLVKAVGPGKLVLDLSCRKRDGKYFVVTDRWQNFSDLEVDGEALQQLGQSCAEFLVHGVDVEGKQLGVDEDLIQLLSASSPKPVTYAGGVRNMADLETVRSAGQGRVDVTVGSALDIFGGSLPYSEVVLWNLQQKSSS
eukprot:jgi/Astpho2/1903/fgenesh1_pm.00038_%23_27_t